jgi:hypothetical protein
VALVPVTFRVNVNVTEDDSEAPDSIKLPCRGYVLFLKSSVDGIAVTLDAAADDVLEDSNGVT